MEEEIKKQTAVEWLLQAIEGKNGKEFSSYYLEFIEQAKEIEKEQMIQFTNNYLRQIYEVGEMTIEDFYNETYGGDK